MSDTAVALTADLSVTSPLPPCACDGDVSCLHDCDRYNPEFRPSPHVPPAALLAVASAVAVSARPAPDVGGEGPHVAAQGLIRLRGGEDSKVVNVRAPAFPGWHGRGVQGRMRAAEVCSCWRL